MLHRFITHVQQQHLFPSGQQVLLAVSGGVDSVVLAHLMHSAGFPFAIAHCNFHLRPGDCDRDERFVRSLAAQYGVPVHVAQFSTQRFAARYHLSIEDAARRLRYAYFRRLLLRHGYAAILTAHHRDDSAETFFLNLLRGTGLSGLHGILPVQGNVVRPLLPFSRADIEAYASRHGLLHVEDVTNASLLYRRNQVRHQLLPLLRELQPAADATIAATIAHLQSVESLYQSLLQPLRERYVVPCAGGVRVSLAFAAEPHAEQLLFELLRPYGFNGSVVASVLAAVQPGRVFTSATHRAVLDRGCLLVAPLVAQAPEVLPAVATRLITSFSFPDLPLRHLPPSSILLDADTVRLPLSLRHWREADRFQPLGMAHGSQLVSDYFTDHKYTLPEKQAQLLLVDADDTILWIVGRRTTHPHRVTPSTRRLLEVVLSSVTPAK